MEMKDYTPKPFWKKPEGITGAIFLTAIVGGIGFGLTQLPWATIFATTLYMVLTIAIIVAVLYVLFDPKLRNLMWYMYKSVMRWVTGLFINVDPIGVLKSYVSELEENIAQMNKQIRQLKGQMHKLQEIIFNNKRDIKTNIEFASKAKKIDNRAQVILKSRKAGRLKESNIRLEQLYTKMEVMYRVLSKMHENSVILKEDVKDQVAVKEQERKFIHASHGAMQSAMNVINGNKDKRYMFDQALEAIADDVSHKVGEMERFMDMSRNFMDSIDLQNGVFEEEGLAMLEKWEKEGVSRILGEEKSTLLEEANRESDVLDLDEPIKRPEKIEAERSGNQYDSLFD